MIWLGIDTSTTLCRACLWHAGNRSVLREESQDIATGHAELLMAQIEKLFADGVYSRSDVMQIVCSIGPGSFTGVRVGLASAKALAQALKIPLVGVSTLESLAGDVAKTHEPAGDFAIVIDARRAQVYWQRFTAQGAAITAAALETIEHLGHLQGLPLAGTGASALTDRAFFEGQATGSMDAMMRSAKNRSPEARPLVPLYLRSADAKQPKNPFAVERQNGAPA